VKTKRSLKKYMSCSALQLANEQRSAYGLRYNDFTRYR
jgi:signal recognition particle subunit SRP68